MEKYVATPQLGFTEAVKLAWSRLFDFKGRSRRSEFWWYMLAFYIVCYLLGLVFSSLLPGSLGAILSSLLWVFALGVTIRRLQDNGHSKWWVIISLIVSVVYNAYFVNSDLMFELSSINFNPEAIVKSIMDDPLIMVLSILDSIFTIVIVVMCLIDGKPEYNKYGDSPKYKLVSEA
jgi:uncharacterized membrane protein YhaH (DUF805 family)